MLKYSFKYAPSYTLVTLGEALGRGAWHIIGVLFTKYLFDSIEAGIEFKTVLCSRGVEKQNNYLYKNVISNMFYEKIGLLYVHGSSAEIPDVDPSNDQRPHLHGAVRCRF